MQNSKQSMWYTGDLTGFPLCLSSGVIPVAALDQQNEGQRRKASSGRYPQSCKQRHLDPQILNEGPSPTSVLFPHSAQPMLWPLPEVASTLRCCDLQLEQHVRQVQVPQSVSQSQWVWVCLLAIISPSVCVCQLLGCQGIAHSINRQQI